MIDAMTYPTAAKVAARVARLACRAFHKALRLEGQIGDMVNSSALVAEHPYWDAMAKAYMRLESRAEESALDAILAVHQAAVPYRGGRYVDQGNLAVAVDGRIFAAVWDQDATQRAEGIDVGAYRVFVIDQAKVVDLTPEG